MTIIETTEIVVVPQITAPADLPERSAAAIARWRVLAVQLEAFHEEVAAIGRQHGLVMGAVAYHLNGEPGDTVLDLVARATGWEALFEAVTDIKIGADDMGNYLTEVIYGAAKEATGDANAADLIAALQETGR